jgi:oxygen-independent coproporphyrinogen-3 oxidase
MLDRLLKTVGRLLKDPYEFTVEVNPESLDADKLALFLDRGVNRISIGAQSFNDVKLKKLGRQHDAAAAADAVEMARRRGFGNISVDLIFGVAGETPQTWRRDLESAAAMPVEHISCYDLEFKALEAGEDASALMYACAIDLLPRMGFRQYEISNFAKPGFECAHNINYWDNGQYIGLGPAAVSYIDGKRSENIRDAALYSEKVLSGIRAVSSEESLAREASAKETAAFKIRMMSGIGFGWFSEKTGFDLRTLEQDALDALAANGLIEYFGAKDRPDGVRLTRSGILVCDIVSRAFL